MAATWSEVLDLYGRALLDFDADIDGNAATATFGFQIPADLGALPPELEPIAANLADLAAQVERRVQDALDDTGRQQAAVTRARRQAVQSRPAAKYIDVNG
jgi:hypothetical protein